MTSARQHSAADVDVGPVVATGFGQVDEAEGVVRAGDRGALRLHRRVAPEAVPASPFLRDVGVESGGVEVL